MDRPIPEGFVEMIKRVEGIDSDALIASLDTPPGVSLRFNTRKATMEEMAGMYEDMQAVEWCPEGRRLTERPKFTLNPLLHAGVFYVQDASSMIYSQIVSSLIGKVYDDGERRSERGVRVLDFCAAPGGKTTAMINVLPDDAQLVANEFDPRRGKILRENLEKWGYGNVIMTGDDAEAFARMAGVFDIVAIDAPCSGEGMMRKDEDARAQWSERLVGQCARLQREILDNVGQCVRPGGYLIYSTCTFNPVEDEGNARYIRDELGFEPLELQLKGTERVARGVGEGHPGLRFMPHLTEGEGLYVCVFRRPRGENDGRVAANLRVDRHRKGEKRNERYVKPEWLSESAEMIAGDELVTALPKPMLPLLELLRQAGINITGAGLPIGVIKDKDIIPDSRVVLSDLINPGVFPIVELSEEEALRYLRREALTLPADVGRGYVCVAHKGHPLGLVKNVGNRANNMFPQHWRIRSWY